MTTKIEWTDETINPIVGCSRVAGSPGCKNCYAAEAAKSARLQQFSQYQKVGKWNGVVEFVESQLLKPLGWKKPKRIFVCSMADIFHENVPDQWINKVIAMIALCPRHTFQVLTKRPERMWDYFSYEGRLTDINFEISSILKEDFLTAESKLLRFPLPNLWLGVSVENQKAADERIPLLLQTPATIRFLSCEPLLEELALGEYFWQERTVNYGSDDYGYDVEPTDKLHWVIVGGESGSKARICSLQWIRSLVRQCQDAEVPIFVKQLGSNVIASSRSNNLKLKDKKGGNIDDFPEDLKIREFPA